MLKLLNCKKKNPNLFKNLYVVINELVQINIKHVLVDFCKNNYFKPPDTFNMEMYVLKKTRKSLG